MQTHCFIMRHQVQGMRTPTHAGDCRWIWACMQWHHVKPNAIQNNSEQILNAHLHCLLRRWSCWLINFVVEKPKQIWTSSKVASQVCSVHVPYIIATSRNLLVLAAVWIGDIRGSSRPKCRDPHRIGIFFSVILGSANMVSSSSWRGCKGRSAQRSELYWTWPELLLHPLTLVATFPYDARWWNKAVVGKLGCSAKMSASLVSCKKEVSRVIPSLLERVLYVLFW